MARMTWVDLASPTSPEMTAAASKTSIITSVNWCSSCPTVFFLTSASSVLPCSASRSWAVAEASPVGVVPSARAVSATEAM
ncbi:MAG TPA: hypothetical protein VF690_11550 [Hymenobacter sp.]